MIVLKMNFILMFAIFILSLRKLNAPSNAENEDVSVVQSRSDCFNSVSHFFKDEVYTKLNAKKAYDSFQLIEVSEGAAWTDTPDLSCCTFHMFVTSQPTEVFYKFSDVFAYFILFKDYLISDGIPSLRTFCKEFKKIIANPATCAENLALIYTGNKHDALLKAFFRCRIGDVPSEIRARVDIEGVIDLSLEYFNRIRSTFKLQMKENGMPGPQKFCNERYK